MKTSSDQGKSASSHLAHPHLSSYLHRWSIPLLLIALMTVFRLLAASERAGFSGIASPSIASENYGFCGTRPRASQRIATNVSGIRMLHALPPADSLPEPTIIEVLLLYTPQAVIGAGGENILRQQMLDNIDNGNRYFTRSLINVQLRPVYIGLMNYTETGSMYLDGMRLVGASNGLEKSRTLRNDYKADITVFVTELEDNGIGGDSWSIPPPTGGGDANAFCLVRRVHLHFPLVMIHEIGHLLGCDHSRENSTYPLTDPFYKARFPYIFGHRFQIEGVGYADIMTYPPAVHMLLFGNPDVVIDGVPTGAPETDPQPSNTARTINQIAPYVSTYREALSRIEFSTNHVIAVETHGAVTVHLQRTGDLSASTRVMILIDSSSTATAGADYVRPANMNVSFAANQAAADFIIPLLTDQLAEGEETIRLSLTAPTGHHGIGWVGTTTVSLHDPETPPGFYSVSFPDGTLSVHESDAFVRVRVSFDTVEPVSVPYHTENGTAQAGKNYEVLSGTLTNSPEEPIAEIAIPIHFQPGANGDQLFSLVVGGLTNQIRILDDDALGAVTGTPGKRLQPDAGLNVRIRADGKLLLWGHFSHIAGKSQTGLALANPDGSLDESFHPPEFLIGHRAMPELTNAFIGAVEPLPDGGFLVGGLFSRLDGQPRLNLAKLRGDGSLDPNFNPALSFDGPVYTVARQPNGQLLAGGLFKKAGGEDFPWLVRLSAKGELDQSFQTRITGTKGVELHAVLVQPDGRILIGGSFDHAEGNPSLNLARLNPDGSPDKSFIIGTGVSGAVHRIAVQPDGRILIAGRFLQVNGRSSPRIARLLSSGAFDSSFKSPNPNSEVKEVIALANGRIVIAGLFTTLGGTNMRFLATLRSDGTIDPEFKFGTGPDDLLGNEVTYGFGDEATGHPLALQADGSLYVAGAFRKFNGLPAPNLVRLRFGECPPRFAAITRTNENALQLSIEGLPGGAYPLETSADLKSWAPDSEIRLQGYENHAVITVLSDALTERRFFRLRGTSNQ
jgi:uncharacterized delta-60 repeat protein